MNKKVEELTGDEKILNVYIPHEEADLTYFKEELIDVMPEDVELNFVKHPSPSICEVGWNLPPMTKLRLHLLLAEAYA